MDKIKRALTLMCVIYTVIISGMFLVGWSLSDSASLFVPTPSKALLMLLFSAILGFASLILRKEKTGATRTMIHYAICLAAFVVTVIIGGGVPLTGATPVIAGLLFTVVYAVIMAVRAVICRRSVKKTEQPEVYTSVFK